MIDNKLYDKLVNYDFQGLFHKLNYAYFIKGFYNLNIIGIRNMNNLDSNEFNDFIVIDYIAKDDNRGAYWNRSIYPITTDPGVKSRTNPINNFGCAILAPNQYRGCWTFGYHKGRYEALVQTKPVKVYRDNNKDKCLDIIPNVSSIGVFGINIHKAGTDSEIVDTWSAGCQVFKREKDFNSFMALCHKQAQNGYGKTFTYTLIESDRL